MRTRFVVPIKQCFRSSLNVFSGKKNCFAMLNQNNSGLLSAQTPLQIPKRTMAAQNQISLENPLADYKRLIENMLNENLGDDEQNQRYKAIAAQARNLVWQLLFDEPQPPTDERMKKAGDLLKEHKTDACFFVPWDYNDWVIGLRDELLKRKNLEFWRNIVVKEQLGLCCARDSDYFDDMEDPEPAKFYEHADCKAPWLNKAANNENSTASSTANTQAATAVAPTHSSSNVSIGTNEYKISFENPLADYKKHTQIHLTENTISNDEQVEAIYKAIAESARKATWSLLFDDPQPPTDERQIKAGDLLKEHKIDAAFYAPWVYNDWIVKLKAEVLKRQLLDFWRNQMVKRELGPCWARDSDYFDDMEDPEPAKFYEYADCKAAWLSNDTNNENSATSSTSNIQATAIPPTPANSIVSIGPNEYKISLENPLADYKKLTQINLTGNTVSNDEQVGAIFKAIAESARKAAWSLLFDDPQPPSAERQSKVGDLLREHKIDAAFYAPWDYNDWIVKVKAEVLKHQLLDFWRNQMVKRELGLCWARDSDYFDNMEDPEPVKFYEVAGCKAAWLKEVEQNRENEQKSGDGK